MIPIRDDNPTRTFAFVTVTLIVVNLLIFLFELSLAKNESLGGFFGAYALIPAEVTQAGSPHAYLTVFTSMFLHANWLHVIGNMWFLWIFGNNVEDSVGHFRFILFYLLCGCAAAAGQILMDQESTLPMVGASGAISGVLGAYLLLFPRARVLILIPIWIFIRFVYVPAWLVLIFWFVVQLLSGAVSLGQMHTGGVAFWAHIGGFVAGLILIPLFKQRGVRLFQ